MCSNVKQKYSIWIFLLLAFWDYLWPLTQCYTQQNTFFIVCPVWKGIRVTMLDYSKFDILASIPIWLYYIPFLPFCNLASVHLTFVLRPCRIFIVQCVVPFFVLPLFILRPAIILTSSCHHCFVYANCNLYIQMALHSYKQTLSRSLYTGFTPPPPTVRVAKNVGRGCVFFYIETVGRNVRGTMASPWQIINVN